MYKLYWCTLTMRFQALIVNECLDGSERPILLCLHSVVLPSNDMDVIDLMDNLRLCYLVKLVRNL